MAPTQLDLSLGAIEVGILIGICFRCWNRMFATDVRWVVIRHISLRRHHSPSLRLLLRDSPSSKDTTMAGFNPVVCSLVWFA